MPLAFLQSLGQSLCSTSPSSRPRARQRSRTLSYEALESRELLAVLSLQNFSVSEHTGEKPQSKVWEHAGQWWTVMPKSDGTWVWRLDGTSWNPTLRLTTNDGFHADVKPIDNLAHVLLEDGNSSQLASIEYIVSANNYAMWSERPQLVSVPLSSSTETATIDIDSTGRMWVGYDVSSTVEVRYSDGNYSTWSSPITVASGINSDDISVLTALPNGQIAVLWSNQSTDRFGFRIHVDGTAPDAWLAPEVPAAQSAASNMADDHLNVAVASDGTVFVAVKTSFNSSSDPAMALLVRRPNGAWEQMHAVDNGGTRPIVVLNEAARRLIVAFTTSEGGGDIVYRESSMDNISFSARRTLIDGSVNNVTSAKQNFTNNVVIMASSSSTVRSVLFSIDNVVLNEAPQVDAGPDHVISFGTTLSIDATASDDGLPTPANLTTTWTKFSGPGDVTFGNNSLVDTTAQFSEAGTYVLRLTANDGQRVSSDDLTVVVTSPPDPAPGGDPELPPPVGNEPIHVSFQDGLFPNVAYAGTIDTQISNTSPGANFGTATVLDVNGDPDGAALLRWDLSEIPAGSIIVSAAIQLNITTSSTGNYEVYALQQAWDEIAATWQQYANSEAWQTSGADGPADHDSPVLGQLNPGSNGLFTISLNNAGLAAVQSWIDDADQNYGIIIKDYSEVGTTTTTTVTTGWSGKQRTPITQQVTTTQPANISFSSREAAIASLRPKLILTYESGIPVNQPPQVDAGAGQTITIGGAVALDATVGDDGLPEPASLTTTWTKSSGPGTVTFGDASAVDTTAQFSTPGTYVLRLMADDGEHSTFDEVTIVVQPPNTAPQVNAGLNDTITFGQQAALDGTVTDDGLPTPATLTTTWTKVSGPGTVTFGNASAVDTTASFSLPGTYVLRLTASDGSLSSFSDVTITVDEPPNSAPVVDAGSGGLATIGLAFGLDGTVTDDGLPLSPGNLTTVWTKTSGPGTVTFGNPAAVDTTAQFSAIGTYVLRLTASDGDQSTFDEITVIVEPVITPPVVEAGSGQTIVLPGSANLDGSVTDDGYPSTPGAVTTAWTKTSGPGTVTFGNASAVDTTASFSLPGSYVLRLTASDGAQSTFDEVTILVELPNTPPVVSAGANQTIEIVQSANLDGTVTDDGLPSVPGAVTTTWTKFSGPGAVTFGNASPVDTTASFGEVGTYVLRLTASDGEFSAFSDVTIVVDPVNTPPVVDAGSGQTIELPSSVNLDGTVSDDGYPSTPGAVTTAWTKTSGPGTVTFGNASAVDTTASFSLPGTYVLRLTANDGAQSTFDEVTIIVEAPNMPPVVSVGGNQSIETGQTANLNGSVSDDGKPAPSNLSLLWTVVSGPGTVTFGDATSAATTADFSTAGTYTLRLTADDGELEGFAQLTVTVTTPPAPDSSGSSGWGGKHSRR